MYRRGPSLPVMQVFLSSSLERGVFLFLKDENGAFIHTRTLQIYRGLQSSVECSGAYGSIGMQNCKCAVRIHVNCHVVGEEYLYEDPSFDDGRQCGWEKEGRNVPTTCYRNSCYRKHGSLPRSSLRLFPN